MNYTIKNAPLSWRHIAIVAIASLGQLIGTGLATLVSVIIPLYQLCHHPELSSVMQGIVGSMNLIGIMIGSAIIGKMTDVYGNLFLFRFCPSLICISAIIALIFPHLSILIVCLFLMGFAIGGEYSLDSNYISELMPAKWTFIMVGGAKAASALGNIIVAAVCFLIVKDWSEADLWPRLLWIMIAISGLMILLRIRFWESPEWLVANGKIKKAETAVHKFLGPDVFVQLPENSNLSQSAEASENKSDENTSLLKFITENWKKVVFTGIPWACEGLGVYGIGVFLPILVMALGIEHVTPHELPVRHVASSVEITLWISCIILPGFVLGLCLINKIRGGMIQWIGFLLSAASLFLLLLSYRNHWQPWISIVSFMSFELFLNMGPHLMTYVLPSKVYSIDIRGQGTGIATSIGKVGAVLGVFFIPLLLKAGGSSLVLIVSIIVMLIGAVITFLFNPDRKHI